MLDRRQRECSVSYVVALGREALSADDLRELANYLSTVGLAGCDVIVIDPSPREKFDENARALRWVARHQPLQREHCSPSGSIDLIRAAAAVAASDKVIVATPDVRYSDDRIGEVSELLDTHEVIEPQEYLEPLPWWGGIEAGRMLLHRAIEPETDHGATFAFRRNLASDLRFLGSGEVLDDQVQRLTAAGAEVFKAMHVFVRREPGELSHWRGPRSRGSGELDQPLKKVFFLSLLPLLLLLAIFGGLQMAGGYAGVIAFATIALAVRGRAGARPFFPLRACLFAPVWVFERSLGIYWALFRRLRGEQRGTERIAPAERRSGEKRASGE